jgi:transposase InsO family protein
VIRFRFVQDNKTELPVKRMCELVALPRSSFYAWLTHTPSARELADAALLEVIRDIYRRSRNTYGVPRVLGQLRHRGHRVARSRVARLMRANGLVGAHASKKWRRGPPDALPYAFEVHRRLTARAGHSERVGSELEEKLAGKGVIARMQRRELRGDGAQLAAFGQAGQRDLDRLTTILLRRVMPRHGGTIGPPERAHRTPIPQVWPRQIGMHAPFASAVDVTQPDRRDAESSSGTACPETCVPRLGRRPSGPQPWRGRTVTLGSP